MYSIKKIGLLFVILLLSSCGYNTLQDTDEKIKAGWSEVLNQYQRRADLVPNLVKTVKAFAAHEKEVFESVTKARSEVGKINVSVDDLDNPALLAKFQEAQSAMSSALSKLIAVAENYPQLTSSPLFKDLMTQLEGTENRIGVARNRYIKAIQEYNGVVRRFPTNLTAMVFGFQVKPNFSVENEEAISKAPDISFD